MWGRGVGRAEPVGSLDGGVHEDEPERVPEQVRVEVERARPVGRVRRERRELDGEDEHDPDGGQFEIPGFVQPRTHFREDAVRSAGNGDGVAERDHRGGERQADGGDGCRHVLGRDRPQAQDGDQRETPEEQERCEVGSWPDVEPLLDVGRHGHGEIPHERHRDAREAKAKRRPGECEVQIREDERERQQKGEERGVETAARAVHRGEQERDSDDGAVGEGVDEQVLRAEVDEVGGEGGHGRGVGVLEDQPAARLGRQPVDGTEQQGDPDDGEAVECSYPTPE